MISAKGMEIDDLDPTTSRLVIDQIDPENLVPGGTDTCINDLVKFGNENILIVGVTRSTTMALGTWHVLTLAGRKICFFPVARIDRTVSTRSLKVPHSFRLALGLARYRRRLPNMPAQVHRIEIGAVVAVLFRNRPFCQFVHNDARGLTSDASESVWRKLRRLYFALERVSLRKASSVVAFTATDYQRLLALSGNVIPAVTWYDSTVFTPSRIRTSPSEGHKLLFVGRLESQKDPLLVVSAFAVVARRRPDVTLLMVGEGSLRDLVERRVREEGLSDRVVLAGAVPRSEVAHEMQRAHTMLLLSHFEGSPRVVAEALATGLTVIATSEADPDRILDGSNGLRVSGRDSEEIGAKILEFLSNPVHDEYCCDSVRTRSADIAVPSLIEVTRKKFSRVP